MKFFALILALACASGIGYNLHRPGAPIVIQYRPNAPVTPPKTRAALPPSEMYLAPIGSQAFAAQARELGLKPSDLADYVREVTR